VAESSITGRWTFEIARAAYKVTARKFDVSPARELGNPPVGGQSRDLSEIPNEWPAHPSGQVNDQRLAMAGNQAAQARLFQSEMKPTVLAVRY
jgi:hypothetical protein